ncbi:unnamed protein product [Staurois parvus]|uniref:Uncharacterized protein n=1 Tax=Staurois parvus TaxID=386267 RepID=A0ABN9AXS1_9NEOB|nr:unnamed protein product [Staurois parvus]
MHGSRNAAIGGALCPSDTANHRSTERAEDVGSVMGHVHRSSKSMDDQCALMISVAPQQRHLSVSISASSQCSSMPPANAHQCHISVPHISAHLSCLSVCQCHLSMPVSATYQCCQCHISAQSV